MKKIVLSIVSFGKKTLCLFKNIGLLINKIYQKTNVKKDYIDLAPINDVTDCEEHVEALQWALSNSQIKNIALAGPYGSGKSSIIQTFLERNPIIKDKSVQISLSTFTDKDKLVTLDVEEGILKQLFYKVQQKDIPQSRYRKIRKIGYWGIFLSTVLLSFLVGIFCYIFFSDFLKQCYDCIIEAGNKISIGGRWSLSLFVILIFIVLSILAKIVQIFAFRFSIKAVNLPKEAASFSAETEEKDILNKKIDEIMYFFEETAFRVVFF